MPQKKEINFLEYRSKFSPRLKMFEYIKNKITKLIKKDTAYNKKTNNPAIFIEKIHSSLTPHYLN